MNFFRLIRQRLIKLLLAFSVLIFLGSASIVAKKSKVAPKKTKSVKTGILDEKEAKPKKETIPYDTTDSLLDKNSSLPIDLTYPREDLNIEPEFLLYSKRASDFTFKPFIKLGFPVFPMFGYMDAAGMDLYSGVLYLGLGAQIKSFFADEYGRSNLQFEVSYSRFKSGEGAGLSTVSNGLLVGTTSIDGFAFSAVHNFYPANFDYFYFGIGGGASYHSLKVEYLKKDIFINDAPVNLVDSNSSSLAPMAIIAIGADIPLYGALRGLFNTDYQVLFFNGSIGANLVFSFSLAYLL